MAYSKSVITSVDHYNLATRPHHCNSSHITITNAVVTDKRGFKDSAAAFQTNLGSPSRAEVYSDCQHKSTSVITGTLPGKLA